MEVGRRPALDGLTLLHGCQDAQGLRAILWHIVGLPRQLEDALAAQPDVSSSNAVAVPGGLAVQASVTWLSAFSPAAAGVRDVVAQNGGRQRFATVADLVVGARLAEVARASATRRCGRAGRCLCHPRSVLVHAW